MFIPSYGSHRQLKAQHYTLWPLYRYFLKVISANIKLQVYSVTCMHSLG
jgi:hypothetical protein